MSTTKTAKTTIPNALDERVLIRILEEGYGPGAWHGADLRAALADVQPELAFWRPSPGCHNIAEIALHHVYCARTVRGQLSATPPEPFALSGEDWFELSDQSRLTWPDILALVDAEQARVEGTLGHSGGARSTPQMQPEAFDLVLGITCHAVYHAGQVQLIKRLASARNLGHRVTA